MCPITGRPTLLLTWLQKQIARAGGHAQRGPGLPPRGLPYEGATAAGDRALSYASWICPPLCIEPALCPHTRGQRDWSLAGDLEAIPTGETLDDRVVFRCLHLVYGVGTIPVVQILAARDRMVAALESGARSYLVATSSHCHALATSLRVWPSGETPSAGPEG